MNQPENYEAKPNNKCPHSISGQIYSHDLVSQFMSSNQCQHTPNRSRVNFGGLVIMLATAVSAVAALISAIKA
ncbi:hypothetical protein ACJ7VE_24700 [Streptomyces sp. PB17]|uniref:hypothetical protein n=1 Tax=Streptomyces sp. PB17 TaxID=3384158 RepID=UPI0038B5AE10